MPRRPVIPPELTAGPFHRRTALAAGLSPQQLRSSCWRRLLPEVYCLASVKVTDEIRLQALLLAAPPHIVVTGRTAAWLYGAWDPAPDQPVPLDCATRDGQDWRFRCRPVGPHRLSWRTEDIEEFEGIRVTSPDRTCFGLMAASQAVDAVVWADSFQRAGRCTAEGLAAYADERVRWPRVRKVRMAIELSHPRAGSPMETRLRMVPVLNGLPEPYVNWPMYSDDGTFLGQPDNGYLDPALGIEYDGAYHFEASQRVIDNMRENGLLVGGIPLLRYGAHAVFNTPDRIVADILTLRPDFAPARRFDLAELTERGRWCPADCYPPTSVRPRGLFLPR